MPAITTIRLATASVLQSCIQELHKWCMGFVRALYLQVFWLLPPVVYFFLVFPAWFTITCSSERSWRAGNDRCSGRLKPLVGIILEVPTWPCMCRGPPCTWYRSPLIITVIFFFPTSHALCLRTHIIPFFYTMFTLYTHTMQIYYTHTPTVMYTGSMAPFL